MNDEFSAFAIACIIFSIIASIIISVIISGLVIWSNHIKTKRIMESIRRMLDLAIEGNFTETVFDETKLSALETSFAHYLARSAISERNVTAEKDKIKALISDISHQTKTPLANLRLYSELLSEQELPEKMRSDVEAIKAQTNKLCFLIDSLIKLSRLENGILTLSPSQGEVCPLLLDIQSLYAPKAKNKGLELITVTTAAKARFDYKWTAEALGNIVDNAIKYTPSGSVTLSASEYELFTRIDVTDTGIGIAEEIQPKIFSRFYRAQAAQKEEGVGLGLYLAREIISNEGGYIKVSSTPDQGSVFSIFLPRSD